MVTLSRQFLYKLYDEIKTRIKSKLNKRFNSSDDPAFISYLLEYYVKREYQDIYIDMSKRPINEEEKDEMKNWAINYLSACHKEEIRNWAIDYISNEIPVVLLDDPNDPTKGTLFYQGIKRDFLLSHRNKDAHQIKEQTIGKADNKNIQDFDMHKTFMDSFNKSIESTRRKELPPGEN